MSNEPSPSSTRTWREGAPTAIPTPSDEAFPRQPTSGRPKSSRLERGGDRHAAQGVAGLIEPGALNDGDRFLPCYHQASSDRYDLTLAADRYELQPGLVAQRLVEEAGLGVRQPDHVGGTTTDQGVDDIS